MRDKVYIYGLSSSDGEIRYVGKSYRPTIRKNDHLFEANRGIATHKNNWIRKVINNGDTISIIILEECNENTWESREKFWISKLDNLTNHTDGGECGSGFRYEISYEEFKTWVLSELPHINSESKWRNYVKLHNLPKNIPSRPDNVFKNKGWISWGNLFNTTNTKKKKYKISYETLKNISHKLNLTNIREWYEYARKENVPVNPQLTYKNKGWVSWEDFLGPSYTPIKGKSFYEIDKCKKIIKEFNFKSSIEFYKYMKSTPIYGVPKNPSSYFRKRGVWNGWKDFLSK